MRLLNSTSYELTEFVGDNIPTYAILSHTWDVEEVTLDNVRRQDYEHLKGFAKVKGCCAQAVKDSLHWVWIDTCCIDKSSSAELSEAINSMYRWYQNADVCYVHLYDVPQQDMFLDKNQFQSALWFRRGWCLQELIAPREVEFYASNWTELGTKWSLRQAISDTTSIPEAILLQEKRPGDFPVAQRMSWASKRNTTREEDMAYCLLGIFDIHMPLLYGEGSRAFIRLQEEIMRRGIDYSIFLWRSTDRNYGTTGLLCDSPRHFPIEGVPTRSGKLHRYPDITSSKFPIFTSPANNKPPEVTPRGLQMTIHTKKLPDGSRLAWLYQTHEERLVCIFLSPQQSDSKYHRARVGYIEIIGKGQNWDVFQPENMCLETLAELSIPKIPHQSLDFRLYMESTADEKLSLIELYPENGLESHEDGSYGMQIDLAFCPEFFIMVFGVEQNSVTHRFIAAFNMFHGHWACRVHKFDPSTPLADLARQLWDLKPVGEDSDRAISRLPSGTYVTVASKRRSRSCRSFMYVSLVPANISADVHLETQMGGLFDGGNNYIC